MVLIDPPQNAEAPPLTNLIALLKDWSVDVGNNAVLDPDEPVARHPGRRAGRGAVSVSPDHEHLPSADGLSVQPLGQADRGRAGWTHGDVVRHERPEQLGRKRPEDADDQGRGRSPSSTRATSRARSRWRSRSSAPIEGATPPPPAEGQDANPNKPETRLVVVGDSDFAANSVAGIAGNRDMFLNMVNWLAQQENLIAVRPRNPEDRRITLTAGQDRMIFWFTLAILPGLVFLAGIQTWWRRR